MSKPLLHPVKKVLTCLVGVLGTSSLIALGANAQQQPLGTNPVNTFRSIPTINSPNQVNTNPIAPAQNGEVVGGRATYPYGSRIGTNGVISRPQGPDIPPSVIINNGNGSTSYYYPGGSRIDVNNNSIPSTGKLLR